MTDEELEEAQKSFRMSVHFMWWLIIIYGNWKRRVIKWRFGFKVYEFHPWKAKQFHDLTDTPSTPLVGALPCNESNSLFNTTIP